MNTFRITALAVAAMVTASACSPQGAPTEAATPPAPQGAKLDGDKPGAPQPSDQITAAALVGRWGDNGDCTKDIVIAADGTFRSYTGGEGRWSLNGDRMTMTGSNGAFEVGVQIINSNTLLIQNADGSIGTSQRC